MARIEGVSRSQAGLGVKLVYRFGPGMMKKMTGRDPQTGSGIEPIQIWAHQPKMMADIVLTQVRRVPRDRAVFNVVVQDGQAVMSRLSCDHEVHRRSAAVLVVGYSRA